MIVTQLVRPLLELLVIQTALPPITLHACWDRPAPGYGDPHFQMLCFNGNFEVQRIGVFGDEDVHDTGTWEALGEDSILIKLDHIKPVVCRFRIDTARGQLVLTSCTGSQYDGTWNWLYGTRD